jgi:hypothetical protein
LDISEVNQPLDIVEEELEPKGIILNLRTSPIEEAFFWRYEPFNLIVQE